MRIQSSHLALRFYTHDGWTEDLVESCVTQGTIEYCKGPGLNYWRGTVSTNFDVDKLLELATKVDRWYDPLDNQKPKETDREYLEGMNW